MTSVAIAALSRLALSVALIGIAPPAGPNEFDLEFARDSMTEVANVPIALPVRLTNNSAHRYVFGCFDLRYSVDLEIIDAAGKQLTVPPKPIQVITRCISGDHGGIDRGKTYDFDLSLPWFGYKLDPGTYTVYAAFGAPMSPAHDNASSLRLVVT